MRALTISNERLSDGWMVVGVEGEIDLATVPSLERAIEEVFSTEAMNLVVDLTRTSFMDSSGLRTLVMTQRRFDEAGRSFAIAVSGGPISRLIDLSGVEHSIRVVDDPALVLGD